MVKHIVMWNLAEQAEGCTKQENAAKMKKMLEALVGVVPGLLKLEVGVNMTPGGHDVCLYSELESKEALAVYQDHPAHVTCKGFVHKVVVDRAVSDYEIDG